MNNDDQTPNADDVGYALIRVLLSNVTKDQKCTCSLPARCVLCLAMMSLGIDAWHENKYRRDGYLQAQLRGARMKSGLWRRQMSSVVDLLHNDNCHRSVLWAAGERDMPDVAYVPDVNVWPRGLIEDMDGPGQIDSRGVVLAPPGWRLESDEELRARVQAFMDAIIRDSEQKLRVQYPESFAEETPPVSS